MPDLHGIITGPGKIIVDGRVNPGHTIWNGFTRSELRFTVAPNRHAA
jgi:hypothetical protein